jgi:hypothetical protein
MRINVFQASPSGLGCSEPQKQEFQFLNQCLCHQEKVKVEGWTSSESELTCKVGINAKDRFMRDVQVSLNDYSARCPCRAGKSDNVLCAHVLSVIMLNISEDVAHPGFKECVTSAAKSFAASIPWKDRSKYRSKLHKLNRIARAAVEEELKIQPAPPPAPPPIASGSAAAAGGRDDDAPSLAATLLLESPATATGASGPSPPAPAPPLDEPAAAEAGSDADAASAAGTPDVDLHKAKRRRTVGAGGGGGESSVPCEGARGPPAPDGR